MQVKDLEICNELSHEERVAVRGGNINTLQIGANFGGAQGAGNGALNLGSPMTQSQGSQTNGNLSAPTTVQLATINSSVFSGALQVV